MPSKASVGVHLSPLRTLLLLCAQCGIVLMLLIRLASLPVLDSLVNEKYMPPEAATLVLHCREPWPLPDGQIAQLPKLPLPAPHPAQVKAIQREMIEACKELLIEFRKGAQFPDGLS